jgi:formyltetrahydrofolate deformylase
MTTPNSVILLICCPDRPGLVASVTEFIYRYNGNVIELEQHVDVQAQYFFMRVEWSLKHFTLPMDRLGDEFEISIARRFAMQWKLYFSNEIPRMAVFVSKHSHCLYDILSRFQAGEWKVELPLVVSNHPELSAAAENLGIDFHVFPIKSTTKLIQEKKQLTLLKDYKIDVIVLARYMQILTDDFITHYPNQIINIHHSFLPAFPGAKPYHSAHDRGVKIIGATSHYVTAELDAGPIIAQDVVHVRHTDSIEDLVRKGQDIEKIVLARAIWHHMNREILVFRNRTIVFN